ncbi:MAG TPA: M1 family metallopeptidase [Thermoanaerobaculia bacterium]
MKRPIETALATLLFLGAAPIATADPLPANARHVADYDIAVRLDATAKTLEGRERIRWRNPGSEPVGELWFHLYLNAFRNSESTFMRESGGKLRDDGMPEEGWGWIEVKSVRRADGADLMPRARFEQPDDGNKADRTVWRVPLPEAVPPGGEIALDVAFEAKLPKLFARSGWVRDYFLVGQWFPKLGVYEPAGMRGRTRGGWNCHQYHANSEFYANFGHYRVAITVPRPFVVGATGRRVARRENRDGTSTHVFEQGDVIDFAWTASPDFVEVKSRFSAERDVTPREYAETAALLGRTVDEVRLGDVEVTLLLHPEHRRQADRHIRAAKAAIKWFGLWYGRYPYATLTVVVPPPGGSGSGGMEYPTFITGGTRALFGRWPLDRVLLPEEVVVHEFGHQYWQSMVATNEFEESWLDEGFTSYSTRRVMDRVYGPWLEQVLGLRLGGQESARLGNSAERMFDRIRTPAWQFSSGSYGFNSYSRTELTLYTLEAMLGEQTMARVMRTYHERFRFGHPSSDDFYGVASEIAGRDLSSFFTQTVERPGIVDYEVSSVRSERIVGPHGIFGEGDERITVTRKEARGREKDAGNKADARSWRTTVVVRRRGEAAFPVSLRVEYEGGGGRTIPLLETPPAAGPWLGRFKRVELRSSNRVVSATVDPDDVLKLDVNRLNNARRAATDGAAAARLATRYGFWLQQLLGLAGL